MGLFNKNGSRTPNKAVARSITPDTGEMAPDRMGFGKPSTDLDAEPSSVDPLNLKAMENVLDGLGNRSQSREQAVNIWDLDAEDDMATAKMAAPDRSPIPAADTISFRPAADSPARKARASRNRTRLIGFDTSEGAVKDVFEDNATQAATECVQFPVGFALVVKGPGRGNSFPLHPGMALIGRGEDQGIRLDFGDTAISRNNHAAIVYDPDSGTFLLGQGGKSNIVRLNGKPVVSNEDLHDGDEIRIGETTLRLKVLVGADFSWDQPDAAASA